MNSQEPEISSASSTSLLPCLQRLWPVYCLLVLLGAFGMAHFDPYQIDGDAVAYMDLGDLIHAHQWSGIVNGYWHPLYPATLALGRTIFHVASRYDELRAYYLVNWGIFALEMLAIIALTDAIVRLRETRSTTKDSFLLGRYPMRYLGLGLLAIASQRELSLGKVRPDALLQALLLLGLAALITYLANSRLLFAGLGGIALGLAFLTKSFAFPITLLCVAIVALYELLWQRKTITKTVAAAALTLICFGLVAGPYVAALSKQKGRLNFGESGSLNYAWFVAGTEKMHLQNGTPAIYGTSEVHLKHPEHLLMTSPVVADYNPFPYGTYPPWFDATYFNDQIKTHTNVHGEIRAISRDLVLIVRYLFNHPEGWVLFLVLLLIGARPDLCRRLGGNGFWVLPLLIGIAIFAIYSLVNVEERYVTVGWLAIILTLFASLRPADGDATRRTITSTTAATLILLLAVLAMAGSFRISFEQRRDVQTKEIKAGWYSPEIFRAAQALNQMGVGPGDRIACAGAWACLYDFYWARLAGVRIMSEIYLPEPHPFASLASTPHLQEAIDSARSTGARVIVGYFDPVVMQKNDPVTAGWISLGDTDFYALPLNPATAAAGSETKTVSPPPGK